MRGPRQFAAIARLPSGERIEAPLGGGGMVGLRRSLPA
jgi:hypothetical protein